jgi:hypothetical protein
MLQTRFRGGKSAALSWPWIVSIVLAWLAVITTTAAVAQAQTEPNSEGEQATIEQWRPALESYVRQLDGDNYRGDFVIEGYLGQLDWLGGDKNEEVSAGRYFAFSVRFRDVGPLTVQVVTTRAVLINEEGKIVEDIEYPNSHLVWPGTRQPYLFGIPALRSDGWRSEYARWRSSPAASCPCPR